MPRVSPSLLELFRTLPDPRDRRGLYHPLEAILGLVAVATLAGCQSLEAIAQFGRDHGPPLAHRLGFRRGKTPAKSTLSQVLRAVDPEALERVIRLWITAHAPAAQALALDGKVLRRSGSTGQPGLHLLALYAPQTAAVLAQQPVPATSNEYKAALQLLGVLSLTGAVVTGDAMFCQPELCQTIRRQGGDYLLVVKDNQPELKATIATAFAEAEGFSPLATSGLG